MKLNFGLKTIDSLHGVGTVSITTFSSRGCTSSLALAALSCHEVELWPKKTIHCRFPAWELPDGEIAARSCDCLSPFGTGLCDRQTDGRIGLAPLIIYAVHSCAVA